MGDREQKATVSTDQVFDSHATNTPFSRASEIKTLSGELQSARKISDFVNKHNNEPNQQFKIGHNYLANITEETKNMPKAQAMAYIHAAKAKTCAEILVAFGESQGLTREQMKNIPIILDSGKASSLSLIKPDGSVENDPAKLIGHFSGSKYDYNGSNPKALDAKDGELEKASARLKAKGFINYLNSCNGQLEEFLNLPFPIAAQPPIITAPAYPATVLDELPPEVIAAPTNPVTVTARNTIGLRREGICTDSNPDVRPTSKRGNPILAALGVKTKGGGGGICLPCIPTMSGGGG